MAVSVYIRTESSDEYLYVFDGEPSHEEVIKEIKYKLEDEFEYISSYLYRSTFTPNKTFKF